MIIVAFYCTAVRFVVSFEKMNKISLGVSFHLKQCGKICRLWIRNVCTSQVHGNKDGTKERL
jgi:hypothetical protein